MYQFLWHSAQGHLWCSSMCFKRRDTLPSGVPGSHHRMSKMSANSLQRAGYPSWPITPLCSAYQEGLAIVKILLLVGLGSSNLSTPSYQLQLLELEHHSPFAQVAWLSICSCHPIIFDMLVLYWEHYETAACRALQPAAALRGWVVFSIVESISKLRIPTIPC